MENFKSNSGDERDFLPGKETLYTCNELYYIKRMKISQRIISKDRDKPSHIIPPIFRKKSMNNFEIAKKE